MKKNTTTLEEAAKGERRVDDAGVRDVVGLDLGDRYSHLCVLDRVTGRKRETGRIRTTPEGLRKRFCGAPMRIALEVGTHSPWVSRLLRELGHEVIVANARKLRLIYQNRRKNDAIDAEYLARLARVDPALLHPLQHRGAQAQADLAVMRSRDQLVSCRTKLINHMRGAVKSLGSRLPACDAKSFAKKVAGEIPASLAPALRPMLETIALLTQQIRDYDRALEAMVDTRYPEAQLLLQVRGVGVLTALAFVLILEDPGRFEKSRTVGAYLGLVPAQDSSGELDPQLHVTKEGDVFLRRLLINCGHYILGPFGQDCDLRRHGEKIAQRGGKLAKKRAAVAVARKLSVLLHHLWRTGEEYVPLYCADRVATHADAAA